MIEKTRRSKTVVQGVLAAAFGLGDFHPRHAIRAATNGNGKLKVFCPGGDKADPRRRDNAEQPALVDITANDPQGRIPTGIVTISELLKHHSLPQALFRTGLNRLEYSEDELAAIVPD